MQELDEGGGARPDVRATNITASSHSVVADLTDEHYLDARDLESLLRADEEHTERAGFSSCPLHPMPARQLTGLPSRSNASR